MKRKPFSWFDLTRLMQDPTYPIQLATELRYSDPQKLAEILKDCVNILVVKREIVKDYNNTRKRRIDNAVLNDLPKYAPKIKKLFQHYMFDFWLKPTSFKLHFVEFHFDIDQLDLLSLLILNSFDETIAQAEDNSAKDTDVMHSLNGALEYWETLQERKKDWVENGKTNEAVLEHYRIAARYRQKLAGITSAGGNKWKSVCDDLKIGLVVLALLQVGRFKGNVWRSLNELVEELASEVNKGLRTVPLLAEQSEMGTVSENRLKAVIKEINHVDKNLLRPYVRKPIPDIKDEISRWRNYPIVMERDPELNFTYPMPKIK